MFIFKPLMDKNEPIPFCEGAGEQHLIETVSYQRSPFLRGGLSGMCYRKTQSYDNLSKEKEKHRLKNSVKLPRDRIIPSSAIKFNSLVSCV